MKQITEFINMGGYAAYVWSAYGISMIVLLGNIVYSYWQAQRVRRKLIGRKNKHSRINAKVAEPRGEKCGD